MIRKEMIKGIAFYALFLIFITSIIVHAYAESTLGGQLHPVPYEGVFSVEFTRNLSHYQLFTLLKISHSTMILSFLLMLNFLHNKLNKLRREDTAQEE